MLRRNIKTWLELDRRGYRLAGIALILAACFYLAPAALDAITLEAGIGIGFLIMGCLPVLLIFLIGLFYFLVRYVAETIRYTFQSKHILPFALLFSSIPIVMIAPRPPLVEEVVFHQNRSSYERMVELARANQLLRNDECGGYRFASPKDYEHLTGKCISTSDEEGMATSFSISFSPRSIYRPIIYIKDPSKIGWHYACEPFDGRILKRLDTNWFICQDDFN